MGGGWRWERVFGSVESASGCKVQVGGCRNEYGARGESGGEMGKSDLKMGHVTLCYECAQLHLKCDRSYSCMIVCV
jgi:hypothetical protein